MPSAAASCRLPFPGGRDGDDGGIQVISGDTVGTILVLRVFLDVGGGNNNDSAENSWSRCVLLFYLGLELLCFPWDGSSIRVGGLVDGGFLFWLGGFALPRPDADCLELLLLFAEALALCSAAQRRWRGGGERLRSLTAEGLLSRNSCGFPMRGVGFFIWASGGDGGGARRRDARLLVTLHSLAGLRKRMKDLDVILELRRGPFVKRDALVPVPWLF